MKMLQANREKLDEVSRLPPCLFSRPFEQTASDAHPHLQLAQALIRYETLSGDEVRQLYDGKKLNRPDELDTTAGPRI
jgi:hypothetical protein